MTRYVTIILSVCFSFCTYSQTVNINDISGFLFSCDVTIYDDGGPNGNYSETDYTVTICSDTGAELLFSINTLSMGVSADGAFTDELIIYEGFGIPDTSSEVLFNSNTDVAGANLSSPSGCIIVTLSTSLTSPDVTNTGGGFELRIDTQQCIDDAIEFLCEDGILNNGEALIDCGGPNCVPCSNPTICGPNVVDNGNFELFDTTICAAGPDMGFGTLNQYRQLWINQSPVQGWYGLGDYNSPAINVSPDYHNEASCDWTITPHPDFAESSLGIITKPSTINGIGYSEYVQTQLNTPLEAGEEYCVSLRAAIRNSVVEETSSLEFWFHNNTYSNGTGFISYQNDNGGEIVLNSSSVVAPTPQIVETANSPIITGESQTMTYSFCAEGGEEYMVIGNFDPFPEDFHGTYIHIDDLVVAKSCPVDFDLSITGPENCVNTCFDLTAITGNRSGGCEITNDFTFQWFANGSPIDGAISETINVCPVLGNEYTVEVSYTAGCRTATKTAVYQNVLVTAGNDGSTTVCDSDIVVDLFDVVTDEDSGGTWTRTSGVGGVFDFNQGLFTATSGTTSSTFEYIVVGGECNDTSEATVNIDATPNAGSDGSITLCRNVNSSVDLFGLINNEDEGGIWTRLSGTGGIFDAVLGLFTSDMNTTTSTFEYTVTNSNSCQDDTALASVLIENVSFAGTDETLTVCDRDVDAINLYDSINGEDAGGVWTRTSGTGGDFDAISGIFMPTEGTTSSTFEYTINNGNNCPDSSAIVTIVIDNANTAGIGGIVDVCDNHGLVNLFDIITGEDMGGVWIQTLGVGGSFDSVSGTFNPIGASQENRFEYTVSAVGSCLGETVEAIVHVYEEPLLEVFTNVESCDGYTLPELTTGAYFDGPQGSGNIYQPGDQIISSMELYVFAETPGCHVETSFTITINPSPQVNIPSDLIICEGNTTDLRDNEFVISGGQTGLSFTYYTSENDAILNTDTLSNVSNYTPDSGSTMIWVRVEDNNTGCFSIVNFGVIIAELPTTFSAEVVSESFADTATVVVTTIGNGSYEFSIDGGAYQESNVFNNVRPGTHTISVRNILDSGCGTLTIEVCVLGYPKFFTPNGDGQNDKWLLQSVQCADIKEILIFNRYGKVLKILRGTTIGWDGIYKGQRMPSSDYWFKLTYVEEDIEKVVTGHFTLKR